MNNGDFLFFWACSDAHEVLKRFECSFLKRETIANVLVSRESDQRVPFLHFSKSSFASAIWARGRLHILLWSMDFFSLRRISRAFICKLRLLFFQPHKKLSNARKLSGRHKSRLIVGDWAKFRVNYLEFFQQGKNNWSKVLMRRKEISAKFFASRPERCWRTENSNFFPPNEMTINSAATIRKSEPLIFSQRNYDNCQPKQIKVKSWTAPMVQICTRIQFHASKHLGWSLPPRA